MAKPFDNLILIGSFMLLACRMGVTQVTPPAKEPVLPTLFIIGDSTVNNHTAGLLGWGDPIGDLFDKTRLKVVNKARGGRSSRTFLTEGLWAQVLDSIKPGDFVLMQFGHNDGGSLTTSYRASIKGNGDEIQDVTDAKTGKKETVHTYGWYMRRYASDAKFKGATPVMLSPIPRNIWKDEHTVARASGDYGKWAAEAAKSEGVAFIDLNEIVAKRYEMVGPDKVKQQYFPGDHTHTNKAGAELNALCVVEGVRALKECRLKDYLLKPPINPSTAQ